MKMSKLTIKLCALSCLAGSFAYANIGGGGDVNPGALHHLSKTPQPAPIGQPPLDPDTGSMGTLKYVNNDWGFFIKSPNDDFSIGAYGYVQADGVQFFGGNSQGLRSGAQLHRAKLEMSGTVMHDWGWSIQYDFMASSFAKGFITYSGFKNMVITAGQTSPDFSMAAIMSSNRATFLEVPLPVYAFAPYYYEGLYYKYFNDHISTSVSAFGSNYGSSIHGRTPVGASGRIAYSPINRIGRTFAVAVDDLYQRADESNISSFSTVPEVTLHKDASNAGVVASNETHYYDPSLNLIYTNAINNTRFYNLNDLELGGVYNAWSVQGEAINNHVFRDNGSSNLNFFGFYVLASYFLTGESVTYYMKDGDFSDISPIRHRYGAFQLAGQISNLNLTDADIKGGKETNYTLGLNWFINKYVTIKLDTMHIQYTMPVNTSDTTGVADGQKGSTNAVMTRIQLKF